VDEERKPAEPGNEVEDLRAKVAALAAQLTEEHKMGSIGRCWPASCTKSIARLARYFRITK
jgi:dienelactone hydrolase